MLVMCRAGPQALEPGQPGPALQAYKSLGPGLRFYQARSQRLSPGLSNYRTVPHCHACTVSIMYVNDCCSRYVVVHRMPHEVSAVNAMILQPVSLRLPHKNQTTSNIFHCCLPIQIGDASRQVK